MIRSVRMHRTTVIWIVKTPSKSYIILVRIPKRIVTPIIKTIVPSPSVAITPIIITIVVPTKIVKAIVIPSKIIETKIIPIRIIS